MIVSLLGVLMIGFSTGLLGNSIYVAHAAIPASAFFFLLFWIAYACVPPWKIHKKRPEILAIATILAMTLVVCVMLFRA